MEALPIGLPAENLTPSPKSIPKSMKIENSVAKLDKDLAERKKTLNPLNTAAISEYMRLATERDALKEKLRPVQGAASASDTAKTEQFNQIGKSGFFKGPEDVVGPATQAENDAAGQYQRIGGGGFFKEPDALPAAPAVEAKPIPAPGLAVADLAKDTVKTAEAPAINNALPVAERKAELPALPGEYDWGALAKKLGVGVAELVNAFAMGQAGVTDMSQLATGQRLAREGEAAQLKAQQDIAAAELAAQVRKDELDREYEATQQAIQNQFTLDRDQSAAKIAADEAAKKYQYDLGLIRAELASAQKKQAVQDQPEWVKNTMAALAGKQGAAAAEKPAAKPEAKSTAGKAH